MRPRPGRGRHLLGAPPGAHSRRWRAACQPPSSKLTAKCLSPRIREQFPGTEMEKYSLFIYDSLKKTKSREFVPSRDEIEALVHRQEMTSTVYCHGGGSCKITINSHTTAGEVRQSTPPRRPGSVPRGQRAEVRRVEQLGRPPCRCACVVQLGTRGVTSNQAHVQ